MSEFHRDLSSGDWVIIAPGRAARPAFLDAPKKPRVPSLKATCPFENLEKTGNWPPIAVYPARASVKTAKIVVIANKYPALVHDGICSVPFRDGFYEGRTGMGAHEVIITRDHNKNFAQLTARDAELVFKAFRDRCRTFAKDKCLKYAVPFFNWGPNAGASVWHPHYQILALPLVPEHSAQSLAGAKAYFKKNHRCLRCDIIKTERAAKKRVVAENKGAIAITPYASKVPFEVRILPKAHHEYFYKTPSRAVADVTQLLQTVLRQLKKHVNDPDYNVFVHEAPLDGEKHDYHHWHVEVLPRISTPAGVEFSTGIFINIVEPAMAASIVRGEANAAKTYH